MKQATDRPAGKSTAELLDRVSMNAANRALAISS
jgi:hypothetical protein